jgi:hypothetical protein
MSGFFLKLKQRLCCHRWRVSRFQPLIPGTSYTCVKCGMHEQFYHRPPAGKIATATEGSAE